MDILQAIFLGAVQGITEFLPISSSGHLRVLPQLLGWDWLGLQFDVALHIGTLLALVVYFWRDWRDMTLAVFGRGRGSVEELTERRRLAWILLAACVPAGLVGVKFEETFQKLESPLLVASTLAGVGLLLLIADRLSRGTRGLKQTRLSDGLFIGVAQALALVPGVSRSGITITAGLMRHLSRQEAARFSFLLSVPITLGAGVFELRHLGSGFTTDQIVPFAAGVLASAVVGYAAIAFLLDYLRKHDLRLFVYYRWVLAALIVILVALRGGPA